MFNATGDRYRHPRLQRGGRPCAVTVALILSGCSSEPPSAPQPAAPLGVTIEVLGGGCTAALTLATKVSNLSTEPVRLNQLALRYTTADPRCRTHQAPIDSAIADLLAGGETRVVHRLDPKGTLCEAPTGALGCEWTVTADVVSSAGAASGSTTFVGEGAGTGWSATPRPEVVSPRAGAVLSGVVPVKTNYFEGCGAVISARMVVFLFRGSQVVASSPELDLERAWPLDTSQFTNGGYSLGAMQNRCRVIGPLTSVTIRN